MRLSVVYTWLGILSCMLLAGCMPSNTVMLAPTVNPFPTVTPGTQILAELATAQPATEPLRNPATAVAVANQPTATPNYGACPTGDSTRTLTSNPAGDLSNSITQFLSSGGQPDPLRADLQLIDPNAFVRADVDLTGEGVAEIMVGYRLPTENSATLLVFVCEGGQYTQKYSARLGDSAPQIVTVGNLNNNNTLEVLYAVEQCSPQDSLCQYRTGIFAWDSARGQFVNLLTTPPDGNTLPTFNDLDNDRVIEVITRQTDDGNAQTGPIRTGYQIYDWNGELYVLSVAQPDPLRYVVQAIHEADRAFQDNQLNEAVTLLRLTLEGDTLGAWFNAQETQILQSYSLYRLLLLYTFAELGDALSIYEEIRTRYPNPETAPVYVGMAEVYWQTYQTSNNLNSACAAVQGFIEENAAALDLLNRYGSRSPVYTAQRLCPF